MIRLPKLPITSLHLFVLVATASAATNFQAGDINTAGDWDNGLGVHNMTDALLDIPTVSISITQDDFTGPSAGIYTHPTSRWERDPRLTTRSTSPANNIGSSSATTSPDITFQPFTTKQTAAPLRSTPSRANLSGGGSFYVRDGELL